MNNQEKVWALLEQLNIVVMYDANIKRQAVVTDFKELDDTIHKVIIVNPKTLSSDKLPYFLAHEAAHLILGHKSNSIKHEAEANRWAIKFLASDVDHIRSYIEFMQINGIPGKLLDLVQDVLTPIVLSRVE